MKVEPQESSDAIAQPTGTQRCTKKSNFTRRAFLTFDGVQLSYIRQGSGRPIVFIHGWSQCAEEFSIRSDHSAHNMTSSLSINGLTANHRSWLPSSDDSTTTSCAGLESSVRYRKNGHDAMSVVDIKLKVYGVNGLRIADAKTEGKKRMTSLRKAELDERFPGLLKLVFAGKHR
jgi:hypothetical protein